MQNSTSSHDSQNPAPTDITPSMSGMSEACYGNDVWTCNKTADHLCKKAIQAFDTLMSAKSVYDEAVATCMIEGFMSMHGDGGDAEDGDGDGDGDRSRTQGTLEGLVNLTSQAYDKAAQRSVTASKRFLSHVAKHPHGALSSLVSRSPSSLERI